MYVKYLGLDFLLSFTMNIYNIISFSGIFILIGTAWIFSANSRLMNWRVIGWGIGFQILFEAFIFMVPAGIRLFLAANDIILKILDPASTGTRFVFGRLALPPGSLDSSDNDMSLGPYCHIIDECYQILFLASQQRNPLVR